MKNFIKKLLILLIVAISFSVMLYNNIKVNASASFNIINKNVTDIGYGVTLETVEGTSKSDFNSTTTIDGREQRIYTASIDPNSPARVVQWSKFAGTENYWGSMTLEDIAADYEKKHPNEKVLVATNNWLSDTNSNNKGELDAVLVSDGLNYRVSDKQGTSDNPAFSHGYIPRTNFLGFDSTGKKAIFTDDFNNGLNYTSDLWLSIYNGNGNLTPLNIKVDKINEKPLEGEVSIYFSNYNIEEDLSDCVIYKMKGERLFHDFNYATDFVERDAFALGTFIKKVDKIDFTFDADCPYSYYFVSRNNDFNEDVIKDNKIVCQYELLNEYKDCIGGTTYYYHIIRNGECYPGSFGNWNEINCEVHPRTVFIIKEDGSFALSVIDGRQKGATGMDYEDMANFYKTNYNAKEAFNYDGGGSSCMVIANSNGSFDIVNSPSDGRERRVSNATLIAVDKEPFDVEATNYFEDKIVLDVSNYSQTNKIYAELDDKKYEMNDGKITIDNLDSNTTYDIKLYYYDEENICHEGSVYKTKTCGKYATLDFYDYEAKDQSTIVVHVDVNDADGTFFQGIIEIDERKIYFTNISNYVTIDKLKSSTSYDIKIHIISITGGKEDHDNVYDKTNLQTPKAKYPDAFTLELSEYNLFIGSKCHVIISTIPDGTYTTYTYESSDESIATISENGRIDCVGEGLCIITVKSKEGYVEQIAVEVNKKEEPVTNNNENKKGCKKKNIAYLLIELFAIFSLTSIIIKKKN